MENPAGTSGTVRRANGLMTADVGEELLMMSAEQGRYFNLNAIGARIWELIAAPIAIDDLVETLTAEYDVGPEVARLEVERFLGALRDRDLLDTAGAPAA